jgi:hypothetical protein
MRIHNVLNQRFEKASVSVYLKMRSAELGLSAERISEGLAIPVGLWILISEGHAKLVFGSIEPLAEMFEVPCADLLDLVLGEYSPDLLAVLNRVYRCGEACPLGGRPCGSKIDVDAVQADADDRLQGSRSTCRLTGLNE